MQEEEECSGQDSLEHILELPAVWLCCFCGASRASIVLYSALRMKSFEIVKALARCSVRVTAALHRC